MCKGINPKEFLSTYQEWHCIVEGFCDGFWPFSKGDKSDAVKEDLKNEHHYYRAGVVLGVIGATWYWIGVYLFVT